MGKSGLGELVGVKGGETAVRMDSMREEGGGRRKTRRKKKKKETGKKKERKKEGISVYLLGPAYTRWLIPHTSSSSVWKPSPMEHLVGRRHSQHKSFKSWLMSAYLITHSLLSRQTY